MTPRGRKSDRVAFVAFAVVLAIILVLALYGYFVGAWWETPPP
jgi:uncharacterized membrane protein